MKSSAKTNANFGLVNRFFNSIKLWFRNRKLFFIRIVAHSNNPPLLSESDFINMEILWGSKHFVFPTRYILYLEYRNFKDEMLSIIKVQEDYNIGKYKNDESYNIDLKECNRNYTNAKINYLNNHPLHKNIPKRPMI